MDDGGEVDEGDDSVARGIDHFGHREGEPCFAGPTGSG